MLEDKNVNLRVMEKEGLPLLAEWINDLKFRGEYLSSAKIQNRDIEDV